MNYPIVTELDQRFLPELEAMAQQIRRDFKNVQANAYSSAIGSATHNHGHDWGIDCLFTNAPLDECDNVALYIGVAGLNTNPCLCDLAVCWGAGHSENCIETDLLESSVPWSAEAVTTIEAALPTLFDVLLAALCNPPFPN